MRKTTVTGVVLLMSRGAPRRVLAALTIFGLVVAVLAGTGGSASATFPGKNGRIAFATDTGTSPQVIKTVKRDGTNLRRVVAHAVDPDWAPDGSKIVFERDLKGGCSIQISNPNGSGIVDLTAGLSGCEQDPSFTPNGRRILFTRNNRAIWRMNLSGGARERIRVMPAPLELDGGDPSISPGGGTIAFVATRPDELRALFTVNSHGRHFHQLTSFGLQAGSRIDWSPSGRQIVFTEYKGGGPGNVSTIRPDGSRFMQITHYDGNLGAGGAVNSPDGRWILYRRQNDATGRYAIWKMRPDGSQRTRVRNIGVLFVTLDWGPQR
jgi:Tol biopolymer transport system component